MPDKQASTTSIEKLEKGQLQVERLTISVVDEDKEAFLANPSRFLRKLLVARKEVVNGIVVGSRVRERLKSELSTTSAPITPLVVVTFHVEKGDATSFRFTYDTITGAVGPARERAVLPSTGGKTSQTSFVEIEKLEKGTFGIERLTLNIADEDKDAFSKDPESFIRDALVSKGEKVKALTIDTEAIDAMRRRFDSGGVPVAPLVIVFVHVEAPAQYASIHCKYDTERGTIVR